MKKIYNIMLAAVLAFSFASCSDDTDNPYDHVSTINVVKQSVAFDASASTGKVVVKTPGGITRVALSQSWCEATFDGDTVTVTAPQNQSLETRYSKLTVWAGEDSTSVMVQQNGYHVSLPDAMNGIIGGDDASVSKFFVSRNVDIAFSASEDWITPSLVGDSLVVSLAANNTGHVRSGYVYYSFGDTKDSIAVKQFDFDKDFAGECYLTYYTEEGKFTGMQALITKNKISLPNFGFEMPISVDESTGTISVQSGAYLGSLALGGSTYYIYQPFADENIEYWTSYNTNSYSTAEIEHIEDGYSVAEFGGTFGGHEIAAFIWEAFSAKKLAKENDVADILTLYYPALMKFDEDASASKFSAKHAVNGKQLLNLNKLKK